MLPVIPRHVALALALILGLALILARAPAAQAQAQDDEVPNYVAVKASTDRESYRAGEIARVTLELKIDPRVHINAHVPSVDYQYPTDIAWADAPGLAIDVKDIAWPKAMMKAFEFTEGAKIAVLEGTQKITIPVKIAASAVPGTLSLPGTFSAQGCTHSICYAPQFDEFVVKLAIVAGTAELGVQPAPPSSEPAAVVDSPPDLVVNTPPDLSGALVNRELEPRTRIDGESKPALDCPVDVDATKGTKDKPLLWVFLASYMGGILLTFTPCVLPLVPITIGIFARQQSGGGRPVVPALMYVLGLALVYAALGTSAALTGNLFGSAKVLEVSTNAKIKKQD